MYDSSMLEDVFIELPFHSIRFSIRNHCRFQQGANLQNLAHYATTLIELQKCWKNSSVISQTENYSLRKPLETIIIQFVHHLWYPSLVCLAATFHLHHSRHRKHCLAGQSVKPTLKLNTEHEKTKERINSQLHASQQHARRYPGSPAYCSRLANTG